MKICLSCSHEFSSSGWICPACGKSPAVLDGFPAFAPELARGGGGFFPDAHEKLDKMQHKSFWFRARNRLIKTLAGKYCAKAEAVLEIGCGTGYVLNALAAAMPGARLCGSELDLAGLALAAKRLQDRAELFQMDARRVPFREEFDLVVACDLLEHIEDDLQALREIRKALKSGGMALLTVPQHPFLWSSMDERACHKRRYRMRELAEKAGEAGFVIVADTSFVTTLFPFMFFQRFMCRGGKQADAAKILELPHSIDRLFELCLLLEVWLIGKGMSFPFGGSRVVLARRD